MSHASSRIQLSEFLHWHFFGRKWHVRFTNSFFFFFFTRKRFVSSCNLHHLNLDHVKLNRLCIDCVLGRKNTNGTFSSLTVSKSLQNVFKIDVIAIWRCREKKLRRRWFSLIARFISARRQKKSWLCNDALKNIALWIKDSSLVTFFCVHSST